MSNYLKHLQSLSSKKTLQRKKDYINYNINYFLRDLDSESFKALEIGPGLGEFESFLNDKDIVDIDIVDNDPNVIKHVSKSFKVNKKFLTKKIDALDKVLGKYDLIFLMQVLEHLPINSYHKVIKLLYHHLKPNSYLFIIVPNANNPLGLAERYGDLQHTSSFTTQSLKDLVLLSGINNFEYQIRGYEIPPYGIVNIIRVVLQKILHFFLLLIMIINGGIFFKTMTPNIMLVIKKK